MTRPESTARRRGGAHANRTAAWVLLLVTVAGCGLPGETDVRVVDDGSVPYRLLDRELAPSRTTPDGPVAAGAPVVFWLRGDDLLAPAEVPASCADGPNELVETLLRLLEAPPDASARSVGRSSAIPPSSELELVEIEDGEALVALDPATSIAADRLPFVVGQLVLTVTSAPGVDRVRLSIAGDAVPVPLPGGALTSLAVEADDYVGLVVDRYLDRSKRAALSPDIGCPPPTGAS